MSDEIQAGYYKGRAIAGSEQYGVNPTNGNEQIAIDIGIPAIGRTLTTFLYFSEAATQYAIDRLRACGWEGDDVSALVGVDKNEIDVQIKYEDYQGKRQMKVEIATGGGRVKLQNVMDDRQKRAFAARMKAVLRPQQAGGVSRPPQNAPRQAPSTRDEDIPF